MTIYETYRQECCNVKMSSLFAQFKMMKPHKLSIVWVSNQMSFIIFMKEPRRLKTIEYIRNARTQNEFSCKMTKMQIRTFSFTSRNEINNIFKLFPMC